MEMTATHQSMLPIGPGAIIYPGRCSAWQPVVTSMHSMVEVPKESIIANTDFTTTSIIAKRRLSSKKRRMQHQNKHRSSSTSSDATTTESSNHSPVDSSNGSPAMTSAISTPEKNDVPDPFTRKETSDIVTDTTTSVHSQLTSVSTSCSNGIPFRGSDQFISMPPPTDADTMPTTHGVGLIHNQLPNPVLSHLQQGLNYRFLQEQTLLQQQAPSYIAPSHIAHPQPLSDITQRPSSHGSVSSESGGGSGFKWCVAHIVIAQQIQQHKQQQNGGTTFPLKSSNISSPNSSFHPPNHTPPSSLSLSMSNTQLPPPQSTSTAITGTPPMHHHQQHQQQQQQQHLALMHYNLPANNGFPPGYVAIPPQYIQELQLRMHQSLVPMATHMPVDSMLGLNSGIQVIGGGIPLQQAQLAHLVMSNPNTAPMVQGPGSWMTPVPVMSSCVINNPFQPGTMAAPWVK